ncbi:DNA-binding protein [Halobacteriales archaeon QH_2_65_14]|nr:MAG: DNA-binding protein [Halobacteriales archaeon QH_2_65_14]
MRHVRVRFTANGREGDIHPVYDLLANGLCIERATALQWNLTGDATASFLHYVEGNIEAFEQAVTAIDRVTDYDLVTAGEGGFYAYIQSTNTESFQTMADMLTDSGIVVVPPIVYHEDGAVTMSVFGPGSEIQAGIETFPSPIEIEIEEVGGLAAMSAAVGARLSDRQREAIEAALELGYYDVPREASHEDVATELDCAPSTAAEHLRKAESKLLRTALGNQLR